MFDWLGKERYIVGSFKLDRVNRSFRIAHPKDNNTMFDTVQHRCAKTSVDVRIARNRCSLSLSKVSPVLTS